MINILAGVTATIVTVPVIVSVIIYFICQIIIKNSRTSLFLTADLTTLFFIMAVHYILLVIFGKSVLWLIAIILFFTFFLSAFIHWKANHELQMAKIFKGFWRFSFLFFAASYLILIVAGMIYRVFTI